MSVISKYAGGNKQSSGRTAQSQTYQSKASKDAEAEFLQSVVGRQLYAPGEAVTQAISSGMLDPVKALSLNQTTIAKTTELYMANKGIQRLHPNFKKFTNLAILFLNDNELTTLVGLLPEPGRKSTPRRINKDGADEQDDDSNTSFLPEHVKMSSTFKFIAAQKQLVGNNSAGGGLGMMSTIKSDAGMRCVSPHSRESSTGHSSSTRQPTDKESALPDLNATLAQPPTGCRRLKKLFLSGNRLTTLEGDLQHLKYLETLLIANNNLQNMALVVDLIKHLRFLRQLDLFGNPLCEEQHYRLYVINAIPNLEVLDRSTITPSERRQAKELFGDKLANYELLLEQQGKGLPDAALRKKNRRDGRRGSLASSMMSGSSMDDSSSLMGGGAHGAGGSNAFPMTLSAMNSSDGVGIPKGLMRNAGVRSNGYTSGGSQFDTPRSGKSGANGASKNNVGNTIAHASGKMPSERTVGFGSTFVVPPPIDRVGAISASVANLEMKCTLVKAEEAARKRRAKDKLTAEVYELQDQRKKFHQLWEAGASLGGPQEAMDLEATERRRRDLMEQSVNELASNSSKRRGSSKNIKAMQVAAEEQQRREEDLKAREALDAGRRNHLASLEVLDRNVSRLFNVNAPDALDPRIAHLIELQRRTEESANVGDDISAENLKRQIAASVHHLLPSRGEDGFQTALNAARAGSLDADRKAYSLEILSNLLFPNNLAVLKSQFEDLGGVVTANLLPTFLQVACPGGLLGAVHDGFIQALGVAFPHVKKKDNLDLQLGDETQSGKKSIGTSKESAFRPLKLEEILFALCHYIPAVDVCFAYVELRALDSLKRHEYAELKPLQRRKNNINTHLNALKAAVACNPTAVIVGLEKFPRLDRE